MKATYKHHILSNDVYGNTDSGLKFGSLISSSGSSNDDAFGGTGDTLPSIDTNIIGNRLWNNSLSYSSTNGIRRNGPVEGFVLSQNDDTGGFDASILAGTSSVGRITIIDPLHRSNLAGGNPTISTLPDGVLNATFEDGHLSIVGSSESIAAGATCSAIQGFIDSFYAPLAPANALHCPWAWYSSECSRISYLTLQGADIECDAPLTLVPQLFLVLSNTTITLSPSFPSTEKAMIAATNASYSGVVSHGSAESFGRVVCSGLGASAIAAKDSPYFNVEGLTIDGCGSTSAAALVLEAESLQSMKNSTIVSNNNVFNSVSHGISVSSVYGTIIHKNVIASSGTDGIVLTKTSTGTVISDNTITLSGANGIRTDGGATEYLLAGNTVLSCGEAGIALMNQNAVSISRDNMIICNDLQDNNMSMLISSSVAESISTNMIAGNSFSGNLHGVTVSGIENGFKNHYFYDNDDQGEENKAVLIFLTCRCAPSSFMHSLLPLLMISCRWLDSLAPWCSEQV